MPDDFNFGTCDFCDTVATQLVPGHKVAKVCQEHRDLLEIIAREEQIAILQAYWALVEMHNCYKKS